MPLFQLSVDVHDRIEHLFWQVEALPVAVERNEQSVRCGEVIPS